MKKELKVPKSLVEDLKKGLKLPEHIEYETKPHFYKDKKGKLKFIRVYLPIPLVQEIKISEGSSLVLAIVEDKNLKEKVVIMRVKK